MIQNRDFPNFDEATNSNLAGLEELAAEDGQPGDFETIDRLGLAVIARVKRLPTALHRHVILADFLIGGEHDRTTRERRLAIWKRLAGLLAAGLDRVVADDTLRIGDPGERAPTRGEAMAAACREMRDAISRRGDLNIPLCRLERLAEGTPAARDTRELRRHLEMKRIPDVDRWRAEMINLVGHVARVASELHHLQANQAGSSPRCESASRLIIPRKPYRSPGVIRRYASSPTFSGAAHDAIASREGCQR